MKAKVILVMVAIALSPMLHAEHPAHADELNEYSQDFSVKAKEQFGNQFTGEQYMELEEEGGRVSQSMVDMINERFGKYIAPAIKDRDKPDASLRIEDAAKESHQII